MSFESFQYFLSARLMRGNEKARQTAPIRSEETRKRLNDLEAERELKKSIGKDYWEE